MLSAAAQPVQTPDYGRTGCQPAPLAQDQRRVQALGSVLAPELGPGLAQVQVLAPGLGLGSARALGPEPVQVLGSAQVQAPVRVPEQASVPARRPHLHLTYLSHRRES